MWPRLVAANSFNYNALGAKNGKRLWINTAVVAGFVAVAPLLLLAIQYLSFFSNGFMAWPSSNMVIVWLFPIVVILPVTTIMSRKLYRALNNPYLPGLINGIIITLIACTNTLDLERPGFPKTPTGGRAHAAALAF